MEIQTPQNGNPKVIEVRNIQMDFDGFLGFSSL
jgi:hypothetical protein